MRESDSHPTRVQKMIIVPERAIAGLLTPADCIPAVEKVFAAMASGSAYNFPVIREAIGHADALYGFKSGFDRESLALGLKSGGFWPGNAARGLTNHQSTVFLFDADTGLCRAVVGDCGRIVPAKDSAALAAAVLDVLGSTPQQRAQLQQCARQRSVRLFDIRAVANRYAALYLQLIDSTE